MKKLGICTMYYKNPNYGANLQAYALRKTVSEMGWKTDIISYYDFTKIHKILSCVKQSLKRKTELSRNVTIRKTAVEHFNHSIPHSKLYFSNTIKQANKKYDVFITGSDQVWNPDWINPYLSLEFVEKSKRTIAYAASTGKIHLDKDEQEKLRQALGNTEYISIREKESIQSLIELTDKKIEYVLDPTMLLTRDEWNEICSERIIPEEYMFCYFLNGNENLRRIAIAYAKSRGLKIVTLPFLNATYRSVDDGFGHYALYDISPEKFLSLIRYATFVMTDSFHGAVFCHLYERHFIVSSERGNEMGCRLKSLTELFETEERYVNDHEKVSLDTLKALDNIPMKLNRDRYKEMRYKSIAFLKEALGYER